MLGWGTLSPDQGHLFQIPLPRSLSGVIGLRRVTATLAYFSPISARSQKHIVADLRFDLTAPNCKLLQVSRTHCDSNAVMRGTVQHEVFEGQKASVFESAQTLDLRISASEQAKGFTHPVRYGLAVSLEVGEGVAVSVYEEIATQVRSRIGSNPA